MNLLKIAWPAVGEYPGLTLRLCDRDLEISGDSWVAAVEEWGGVEPADGGTSHSSGEGLQTHITVTNASLVWDVFPQRFSEVLQARPPETATVTLYQWFEGAGLDEGDRVPLLTGRMVAPVEFDAAQCRFRVVSEETFLGNRVLGTALTPAEYPDVPENNVGRTKPIVIGSVEQAPCMLVRKMRVTRLTSVAIPAASVLDVASTEGFPVSGTLVVNDDAVEYTGINPSQFTGCTGVNDYHYADDEVFEQVTDHRYLFSDPDYPITSIQNVNIAGQAADPALYSVDLPKGEVVFNEKPRKTVSLDTRFLQAQFDSVDTGNSAVDPLNAANPNSRTAYAKINQANPLLKLKQTDSMPVLGEINKVFLRVEHFVEEKLPNDSIIARLSGSGQVGVLSPPAEDDAAATSGSTDITHTHLDTFGFPVNNANHLHGATSQADHVVVQGASSGPGGDYLLTDTGDVGPYAINVTFPAPPSGALSAEYRVTWRFKSITFSGSPNPQVTFKTGATSYVIGSFNQTRADFDYAHTFTVAGGTGSNSWSVTLNNGALWFDLLSVERTLFYPPNPATQSNNLDTVKSGSVTQHGSSPLMTASTEKTTQTVIDFFDITSLVNRDWNWFTDRGVEIEYNGIQDGRTAFVIHTAFEIEFARRRKVVTDEVTADVEGIKDDASGSLTGTPDALIERPDHVFKWSLKNVLGLDDSGIDSASFDQAGSQWTVPNGYALAGVVQDKIKFQTLWQDWARNSRGNLSWNTEGKVRLRFLSLNQFSLAWGSEVKTLDEGSVRRDPKTQLTHLRFQRTPLDDIVNHIDLHYDRNWQTRSWSKVVSVEDSQQVAVYGRRENPSAYRCNWVRDADQASDLAQFYLLETSRPQILAELEVFPEYMELEPGDVVRLEGDIAHPYLLGTVLPGKHIPGSGNARRMDSLVLRLRLFPVEFLRQDENEYIDVEENWNPIAAYLLDSSETLDAHDQAFIPADDGWGIQRWGGTGWGGKISLTNSILEQLLLSEKIALVHALSYTANIHVFDEAYENENAGWGAQAWGSSGFGGKVAL